MLRNNLSSERFSPVNTAVRRAEHYSRRGENGAKGLDKRSAEEYNKLLSRDKKCL